MKLRLFLVISALVAIVYAVADPFLSGSPSTLPIWSVIVAVGAFIPAIIAFIAQKDSLKTFASNYLSLRKTDWRKAAIVLGATAILSPLLRLVIVGVFGNLLHVSFFGEFSRQFHVNYLGVISWYGSGVADTLMACAGDMVYLFVIGSIVGIFSCLFEEIAWRGFLIKYIKGSDLTMSVISGVVWTLWTLAMTYVVTTWSNALMLLIFNVVLSYWLVRIMRATGSVWTCAMIRGMFSLGAMSFCVVQESHVGSYMVSIIIALILTAVLWGVIRPRAWYGE